MPPAQPRRCMRLLCLCALASLLTLLVRQSLLVSGGGRSAAASIYYSIRGRSGNASAAGNNGTVEMLTMAESSSGSYLDLPRLFGQLSPASLTVVNFTAAIARRQSQVRPDTKPCQRPQSHNLANSLLLMLGSKAPNDAWHKKPSASVAAPGGFWLPQDCWPPVSFTAVIVPYGNRSANLATFVPYMQAVLQRQNIAFALLVVEQANALLFNRAKLINVGYVTALRLHNFDCFVFQDADKVPEDVANVFDCANSPKLLISEMRSQQQRNGSNNAGSKYQKGRLYTNFFGGAVALSREAFRKANGNSNRYYGWGREDDELAARLGLVGYRISYRSGPEGRFVNLRHSDDIVVNKMPWPYPGKVRQTMRTDGLSSLNYTDKGVFLHPMFVLVRADV